MPTSFFRRRPFSQDTGFHEDPSYNAPMMSSNGEWTRQRRGTSHQIRTLLGFGLIGIVNSILPHIIFQSAYLIVPYPRSVVILLQTLPAIAAYFILPHLAPRIPYYARPIALALLWALAAIVIDACPPNVTPLFRVLMVLLAAAAAAGGDVFWLGQLRYYGTTGLVGWACGTGLGNVGVAVMPYVMTVRMGVVLRTGIGYIWYLVPLMLFSHWMILPAAPSEQPQGFQRRKDDSLHFDDEEEAPLELLTQDAPAAPLTARQRLEANVRLIEKLIQPFMLSLFACFALQASIYPGFSRALGVSTIASNYSGFLAAYGFTFQLGNFIGRAAYSFIRPYSTRTMLFSLAAMSGVLVVDALTLITSSPFLIFGLVLCAGLASGFIYMSVLSSALASRECTSGADREFCLGVIGAGPAAGLLIGGLVGTVLESTLCGLGTQGERWCFQVR